MDGMDRNERDLDTPATRRTDTRHLDDRLRDGSGDTIGDEVGEAAGGISGVLAGAALGSLGGPMGTIIGGLAGAVSGWWAGRAISEAASRFTHHDDAAFRSHYEASPNRLADRDYDEVRPAYQLGYLASQNPDYANRSFDEIEPELKRGWTEDVRARHGEWESIRGYARDAYDRSRSLPSTGAAAASTATGAAAYAEGRAADKAADVGQDVKRGAENAWDKSKAGAETAWDRTKQGAERLGDKVADKADDMKDRVDANPASRPGPDATDRPGR